MGKDRDNNDFEGPGTAGREWREYAARRKRANNPPHRDAMGETREKLEKQKEEQMKRDLVFLSKSVTVTDTKERAQLLIDAGYVTNQDYANVESPDMIDILFRQKRNELMKKYKQ